MYYLSVYVIQNVFKLEQEEYTKEEIDWSYIEYIDNQAVLDLIEKVILLQFFPVFHSCCLKLMVISKNGRPKNKWFWI